MANFWFALDVGAYNKKTAHLTLLEHGVYFALMRHYYATGEPLPSEASRLQRICRAHSDEELKAISFIIASFFTLKRDAFHNERCDEEIRKAKEVSKLRGELGRKGGLAKAKAKAVANEVANDLAKSYTVTDTVTVTNTKSKAKSIRAHFSIPSLGEITAYCQERGNLVDPQKWFNHYTANGWKVGPNAMKDWRAAVRTWENNGNGRSNSNRPEATRPVSAQVARFHNNRAEVERTFGAAASVGGFADSSSARQTPRLSTGDPEALEGEVAGVQKLGN